MKPLRAILKHFMRQVAVNCSAVRDITPPWYTHQALRRQWILHSDRWFCSKAFPGSSRELCCPHPRKQRATLAFADHQKLQPTPLVLSSFLLKKTILSQWVLGSSGTNIHLFTLPTAAILTTGSPLIPQRRPIWLISSSSGGWICTANPLENRTLHLRLQKMSPRSSSKEWIDFPQ